jgi:L-methionine (R)-S-oxide reductase
MDRIYEVLLFEAEVILMQSGALTEQMSAICELLAHMMPDYDWVGIYWVNPEKEATLTLLTYVGEPTEHIHIPFGTGICGQVAISHQSKMVADVSQEENYLSCNVDVKSELVIPIMKNNRFYGQLDIDSHRLDAFSTHDQACLELMCQMIARRL